VPPAHVELAPGDVHRAAARGRSAMYVTRRAGVVEHQHLLGAGTVGVEHLEIDMVQVVLLEHAAHQVRDAEARADGADIGGAALLERFRGIPGAVHRDAQRDVVHPVLEADDPARGDEPAGVAAVFQRIGPEGRRADVEPERALVALERRDVGDDVVERSRLARPDSERFCRRPARGIGADLGDQLLALGPRHVRRVVEYPQRRIARLELELGDEVAEVLLRDARRGVEQRPHRVQGIAVRLDARRDCVLGLLGLQLEVVARLPLHAVAHDIRERRGDDQAEREDDQREPQPARE